MPVKVLALIYRNHKFSPAEFKDRYEGHVQLIKAIAGETFPLIHKRSYVARTVSTDGNGHQQGSGNEPEPTRILENATTPAVLFAGQQADFQFDAVTELTFADRAALDAFSARIYSPEAREVLEREEEGFMERGRLGVVLVEDVVETVAVAEGNA